jgi:uncharacterized protein YjiS (DUF1127 family)
MSATTHDSLGDSRTLQLPRTSRLSLSSGFAHPVASIILIVGLWRARVRNRQALATLDQRDLRELGVSQWELERELAKPFWRD